MKVKNNQFVTLWTGMQGTVLSTTESTAQINVGGGHTIRAAFNEIIAAEDTYTEKDANFLAAKDRLKAYKKEATKKQAADTSLTRDFGSAIVNNKDAEYFGEGDPVADGTRYVVSFIGRQNSAIGKTYPIYGYLYANSPEEAKTKAYDKYEHITNFVAKKVEAKEATASKEEFCPKCETVMRKEDDKYFCPQCRRQYDKDELKNKKASKVASDSPIKKRKVGTDTIVYLNQGKQLLPIGRYEQIQNISGVGTQYKVYSEFSGYLDEATGSDAATKLIVDKFNSDKETNPELAFLNKNASKVYAPGKVDESKWDEAKNAVKNSSGKNINDFGDTEWATVNMVYQNMGGKFKSKESTKKIASDDGDVAYDMGQILFVDAISSILENADEEGFEGLPDKISYQPSGQELTTYIPSVLEAADLQMPKEKIRKIGQDLINAINEKWGGKLTVEELLAEFPDVWSRLALVSQGHGVCPEDDASVEEFMESKGVSSHHLYLEQFGDTLRDEAWELLNTVYQNMGGKFKSKESGKSIPEMATTFDREERRKQKEFLKGMYPDYDATRHDAFVYRYNKELDDSAMQNYLKDRGLASKKFALEKSEAEKFLADFDATIESDLNIDDTMVYYATTLNDPSVGIQGEALSPSFKTIEEVENFILEHKDEIEKEFEKDTPDFSRFTKQAAKQTREEIQQLLTTANSDGDILQVKCVGKDDIYVGVPESENAENTEWALYKANESKVNGEQPISPVFTLDEVDKVFGKISEVEASKKTAADSGIKEPKSEPQKIFKAELNAYIKELEKMGEDEPLLKETPGYWENYMMYAFHDDKSVAADGMLYDILMEQEEYGVGKKFLQQLHDKLKAAGYYMEHCGEGIWNFVASGTTAAKSKKTADVLPFGKLPQNHINRFPSGRWGFVGSVDVRLGYKKKDGSELTEEDMKKARDFGPDLAGVTTRAWETMEEALTEAKNLGLTVTLSRGTKDFEEAKAAAESVGVNYQIAGEKSASKKTAHTFDKEMNEAGFIGGQNDLVWKKFVPNGNVVEVWKKDVYDLTAPMCWVTKNKEGEQISSGTAYGLKDLQYRLSLNSKKTAAHPAEEGSPKYPAGTILVTEDNPQAPEKVYLKILDYNAEKEEYTLNKRPMNDVEAEKDDQLQGVRFEMSKKELEGDKFLRVFSSYEPWGQIMAQLGFIVRSFDSDTVYRVSKENYGELASAIGEAYKTDEDKAIQLCDEVVAKLNKESKDFKETSFGVEATRWFNDIKAMLVKGKTSSITAGKPSDKKKTPDEETFANKISKIIEHAIERYNREGQRGIDWEYDHMTEEEREGFDDYLVESENPMASEAGSNEHRFTRFVEEQAKNKGISEGKPYQKSSVLDIEAGKPSELIAVLKNLDSNNIKLAFKEFVAFYKPNGEFVATSATKEQFSEPYRKEFGLMVKNIGYDKMASAVVKKRIAAKLQVVGNKPDSNLFSKKTASEKYKVSTVDYGYTSKENKDRLIAEFKQKAEQGGFSVIIKKLSETFDTPNLEKFAVIGWENRQDEVYVILNYYVKDEDEIEESSAVAKKRLASKLQAMIGHTVIGYTRPFEGDFDYEDFLESACRAAGVELSVYGDQYAIRDKDGNTLFAFKRIDPKVVGGSFVTSEASKRIASKLQKLGVGDGIDKTQEGGKCGWFAGCKNKATKTMEHPILGEVPICDRCYGVVNKIKKSLTDSETVASRIASKLRVLGADDSSEMAEWVTPDWGSLTKAIADSQTQEEAVKKLTDQGWKSTFAPIGQNNEETVAEAVARLWDQTKKENDPTTPENRASKAMDSVFEKYAAAAEEAVKKLSPTEVPDFYVDANGETLEEEEGAECAVYVLETIYSGLGFDYLGDWLKKVVREVVSEEELSDDDLEEMTSDYDQELDKALPKNCGIYSSEGFGDRWIVYYKDLELTDDEPEGTKASKRIAAKLKALATGDSDPEGVEALKGSRVYDKGSEFGVRVPAGICRDWSDRWPGFRYPSSGFFFSFSKSNGDLIELTTGKGNSTDKWDGDGLVALAGDAYAYGKQILCLDKEEPKPETPVAEASLSAVAMVKIASLKKKAERLGNYDFDTHEGATWKLEACEDGKQKLKRVKKEL